METMNLSQARTAYNALSTRETLSALLATRGCWPLELDTTAFGIVAVSQCACRALDLDNLFSARFLGVAIEQRIIDAMLAASETASAEDDLFFTVDFGRVGSARLMARAMPDYVQLFAAP